MAIYQQIIFPPSGDAKNSKVGLEFEDLILQINTTIAGLASIYAPISSKFVTIGTDTTLTQERSLTGTSNQIVVTDNGAGSTVVLSTPQNIHTAATPTFASETLTATTNQIILGTTRTVTLTAPTPASSSRTITFPDLSADYSVVGTEGTQNINGTKSFLSSSGTGFGASPSAVTFGGVDIFSGGIGLVIGADSAASTRTNSTTKIARLTAAHYTNSEEPIGLFVLTSGVSTNVLSIGGGSGLVNAATTVEIRTAANNTTTDGTVIWSGSSAGEITQPKQPSFLVTDGTGATDVTGDGTGYTELWPTEVFDQGSNFASNTFTAPVTGRYLLSTAVLIQHLLTTHDIKQLSIITSNRNYRYRFTDVIAKTEMTLAVTVLADMDANDTATVVIVVASGTKTVDIINDATFNYFSGSLIN